ncbi:MAG: alpha/beta hydrolase [Pseudomonadota bacterium]
MDWHPGQTAIHQIGGTNLECRCLGPSPDTAPTIVMLHEGLGCVSMWRDFPEKVQQTTGYGVFVYSRQGYGGSAACELPRPVDYLEQEAEHVLPHVLDAIGFEGGILFGHSDGGTISGLYLGGHQDHRVRGLILMAPHFFIEPENIEAITDIQKAYETDGLRERLSRHHGDNVDCAFRGWSEAWLAMGEVEWDVREAIAYIRVPVLYIQGRDDAYGSMAQANAVVEECYSPVDVEILPNCQHSPHLEQPDQTLSLVTEFVERLRRIENAVTFAA